MRILWLSKLHPHASGVSGDLLYTTGTARACVRQGAEICILAFDNEERETTEDCGLRWKTVRLPRRAMGTHLLSSLPSTAHRYVSPLYMAEASTLIGESWDAIVVDSIAMGWIVSNLTHGSASPPLVYFSHNDETSWRRSYVRTSYGIKRMALRWDGAKAARLEHKLCERSSLISAITDKDATAFRARYPGKPVVVCPPGYDRTGEIPKAADFGAMREAVILGSFYWSAKQRNLLEFLNRAAAALAAAQVGIKVVGDMPANFHRFLAEKFPSVAVTGKVENFASHITSSRIGLIIDEVGGGFKLKSLDYIFHGLPIVTLDGAMEGLPLVDGVDFLSADTMEDVARQILDVIDDHPRLLTMRKAAFSSSRSVFNWEESATQLLSAISNLVSV